MLGEGSTTQMSPTCVHGSSWEYSRATEVLSEGCPTCSTRLYQSCNCFLPPASLKSLLQRLRKGAGVQGIICWEPSGRCLLLLTRVKQSLFHRHRSLHELPGQNAAVPAQERAWEGSHQAMRPISALLIWQWRAGHKTAPEYLRQHTNTS